MEGIPGLRANEICGLCQVDEFKLEFWSALASSGGVSTRWTGINMQLKGELSSEEELRWGRRGLDDVGTGSLKTRMQPQCGASAELIGEGAFPAG